MAYLRSAEDIYNEMVITITDVDTSENSWIYNALMPGCMRMSESLMNLDEAMKKGYASSALVSGYSYYLELRCAEMGIYRKQATYAVVPIKVTGKAGTILKKGSIVSTLDNRLYTTSEDLTLDKNGVGTVTVIADKPGSIYNLKANDLNYLPINYSGIISITNENDYKDAYNEETDQELYNRYVLKVQTPATSGNKYHYEQWALEVTGVGSAKCISGAGIVRVIIANSNKRAASKELIKETYDHIDEVRPLLAGTLEVITVKEIPINITGNVEIDTSVTLGEVQTIFKELVEKYLDDKVYKAKKVNIAKIQGLLIDIDGVLDCKDIKINGCTSNITLNEDEIAVLQNVNLGVM
ncbi:baseplate J/gp47 family protein [Clostridium butyricum]|uniref:baseplate J/gp47 family protein n=1 Tax=Clostridium butyricum TaxID=1492 RepID=UPI0012B885C9|nr:baseplate J/gp47 family protein [Clostridium butyricum]